MEKDTQRTGFPGAAEALLTGGEGIRLSSPEAVRSFCLKAVPPFFRPGRYHDQYFTGEVKKMGILAVILGILAIACAVLGTFMFGTIGGIAAGSWLPLRSCWAS